MSPCVARLCLVALTAESHRRCGRRCVGCYAVRPAHCDRAWWGRYTQRWNRRLSTWRTSDVTEDEITSSQSAPPRLITAPSQCHRHATRREAHVTGLCRVRRVGGYNVGTVTIDPRTAKSPKRDAVDEAVGSPHISGAENVTPADRGRCHPQPPCTSLR